MAKRDARKSKGPRSSGVSRRIAKVPSSGPVTLKQAQVLARARSPSKLREVATPSLSPAAVGVERKKLQRQHQLEIRRRIQEYKATLGIMKQRGVKGVDSKPKRGMPSPKAVTKPLQIFAEGDSWFDYPYPFFGGGVIPRLEKMLGVPILNLAKAGDEVRYMLGVRERRLLIEQFTKGCPAGGVWDVMLFSGGGNDIVDNPMALWIRDYDPSLSPKDQIHQARLDAALGLVRAGYEDLIGLRDSLSPTTHLVFHGYDFAIPDGRGVCHLGPWLKPTFDLRRFPSRAAAFAVMKALLQQFAKMLQALQASHPKVTIIGTQGTLKESPNSWHNELHPSKDGFQAFAGQFHTKLKALFPTKVL